MVVGQLFCWEGLFSAYMLVSGKVSLANFFKSFSRVNLKTPHQVHKSLTFEGETLKITQSGTFSSRWFQPICKIFTGFGVTPKKPLKPPNLIRLCSFSHDICCSTQLKPRLFQGLSISMSSFNTFEK